MQPPPRLADVQGPAAGIAQRLAGRSARQSPVRGGPGWPQCPLLARPADAVLSQRRTQDDQARRFDDLVQLEVFPAAAVGLPSLSL